MKQPTVYPLFSAPVYVNNAGDFPRPDLTSLQYSSTMPDGSAYNFLSSVDKRVLDRPEFAQVRAVIMKEIDVYTRQLLAVHPSIEFYITDSWINIHRRGHSAGAHMHHNSLLSGVLYLKTTEKSGDIVFHRDALSLLPFPPALDLDVSSYNIYNCKSWGHRPKTNDVCLFPSVVMHSVDPNESDEERWCLAFNVFVRGNIGSQHKLALR
jgi:uncharacterized protein (TIGR02466 family)